VGGYRLSIVTNDAAGEHREEFTDEQATLVTEEFRRRAAKVNEIVRLLTSYVEAGGRGREPFERVLSGLSHEGMGTGPPEPGTPRAAQNRDAAMTERAPVPTRYGARERVTGSPLPRLGFQVGQGVTGFK
jgi:hypothetical protein